MEPKERDRTWQPPVDQPRQDPEEVERLPKEDLEKKRKEEASEETTPAPQGNNEQQSLVQGSE